MAVLAPHLPTARPRPGPSLEGGELDCHALTPVRANPSVDGCRERSLLVWSSRPRRGAARGPVMNTASTLLGRTGSVRAWSIRSNETARAKWTAWPTADSATPRLSNRLARASTKRPVTTTATRTGRSPSMSIKLAASKSSRIEVWTCVRSSASRRSSNTRGAIDAGAIELSDAPEVVDAFTTIGNSGAGRVDSSYDGGPVVRRPGHLLDTGPRVSAAQRARLRSGVRRSRRCP